MTRGRVAFMLTSTAAIVLLVAAAVFADVTPKDNMFRNLSIFTEVFSIVRDSYVETVPQDQLVDGAFAGVTDAIDEFSYYVPPGQMDAWKKTGRNEAPRGAVLSRRFGYGYVVSVVRGSAADQAGLRSGDLVDMIGGQPLAKLSPWQIRHAVASASGPVELAVLRDGETERVKLVIPAPKEETAAAPELASEDGSAILKISSFTDGTAAQVAAILPKIRSGLPLIIDLRENGSGTVGEAIRTADLLLARGTIAELKGRKVEARTWTAAADAAFQGRILLLTDGTTSGAAEVFAGALQGNNRAQVVGRPTYGRAVEQRLIDLPSGGALWMTVGHYSGPDGRYSGTRGLRPDEMVDLTPLLLERDTPRSERPDLILQKALELAKASPPERAAA